MDSNMLKLTASAAATAATASATSQSGSPPTYEESQRMANQRGQLLDGKVQLMLDILSGCSPVERKGILERVVSKVNEQPGQSVCPIYLSTSGALQANAQRSQPALHKWIGKELLFLGQEDAGLLAFSTGHWSEFINSKDENPRDLEKQVGSFFNKYFAREGTEQGVAKLWHMCNKKLLLSTANEKLKSALTAFTGYSVENIQPDGRSSCRPEFNYPVVIKYAVLEASSTQLGRHLTSIDDEDRVKKEFPTSVLLQVCALLHGFIQDQGSSHGAALHRSICTALVNVGRRDLQESLARELDRSDFLRSFFMPW